MSDEHVTHIIGGILQQVQASMAQELGISIETCGPRVSQMLEGKRQRAGDDETYAEALVQNICFFLHMEDFINDRIVDALEGWDRASADEFQDQLMEEREVALEKGLERYEDDFRRDGQSLSDWLAQLELDYGYHYVVFTLLTWFTEVLLSEENRYHLETVSDHNSADVIMVLGGSLQVHANALLGNVKVGELQ